MNIYDSLKNIDMSDFIEEDTSFIRYIMNMFILITLFACFYLLYLDNKTK